MKYDDKWCHKYVGHANFMWRKFKNSMQISMTDRAEEEIPFSALKIICK